MATRPKTAAQTARDFVRHVHGRTAFAPCTGQDHAAFDTFAQAVQLYCYSDLDGHTGAVQAMHGALLAMQEKTRWLAREAIIAVSDYGYVGEVWPHAVSELPAPLPSFVWRKGEPTYSARELARESAR